MNKELSSFAARLRVLISNGLPIDEPQFNQLALELFSLQFTHNVAYRKICEGRKLTPKVVGHWTQIPFVPTSAFKELELTSIAPEQRAAIFHSSGTTEQKPSRHFHSAESLELYEASLWAGFVRNIFDDSKLKAQNSKLICLTPPPELTPHSSLVHMFETVRQRLGASETAFLGKLDADGSWSLDFDALLTNLNPRARSREPRACLLVGTAFSFVHLLDFLADKKLRLVLPENSRIMETGGYKNRSRSLPRAELHALITRLLGVPARNIICEYGMSELSSQAYDSDLAGCSNQRDSVVECGSPLPLTNTSKLRGNMEPAHGKGVTFHQQRVFHFPSWARIQIISPETGREVADGEMGLIRIFDLANVFSVGAIQTEDLGVRQGDGFKLVGRAKLSEPRGCSLMAA